MCGKSRIVISLHLVGQPLEIEIERIISVGKSFRLLDMPTERWVRGVAEKKLLNHQHVRGCFRMKNRHLEDLFIRIETHVKNLSNLLGSLQKRFNLVGLSSISKLCGKGEGL